MSKEHRSWLVVAAVTTLTVVLGIRTMGSATAQEEATQSAVLTWSPVKSTGLLGASAVYRAKVPGGWLVVVREEAEKDRRSREGRAIGIGVGAGAAFVPDPQHSW